MEIKGQMLREVIQQFREEWRKKRRENGGVIPLLCFINATPCAPVSGEPGPGQAVKIMGED